jgi:glycosyltransferase involved in cell wall biosynthesis
MRIVFVIGRLGRAGSERQMIMLASDLVSRGHIVRVISLDGHGDLDTEARESGLIVKLLENKFPKTLRGAFDYIRYVRNERPDIVYSFLPKQHIFTTMLKPLTMPAKIVWGIRASKVDWTAYRLRARVFFPVTTFLSRWADAYIANSWSGARYHISEGYVSSRMRVIPNGVDTKLFRPDLDSRIKVRSFWNVNEVIPVIGMLARFDPMKGNGDFLEIAGLVLRKIPNAMFISVGHHTNAQAQHFRKMASLLGISEHILLFDAIDNPQVFLNGIDVLVSPSKTEGFPNAVLEAMACGTPVVGTDVGDTRRIVGDRFCLAKYGDFQTMSDDVVKVLEECTTDNFRQHIIGQVGEYSRDQLTLKTESALMEIIRNR